MGALALVPHRVIGAEHPAQPNMRRVADRLQYRIDLHHMIPCCPDPNVISTGPTAVKPAVGRMAYCLFNRLSTAIWRMRAYCVGTMNAPPANPWIEAIAPYVPGRSTPAAGRTVA